MPEGFAHPTRVPKSSDRFVIHRLLHSLFSTTDELYKHGPFMSYLNWPRLHFMGRFQADMATVNNDVRNYNMSNFTSWNSAPMPHGNGQWNPNGTGAFRLIGGQVTSVCYVTGLCSARPELDRIIGSSIRGELRTPSCRYFVLLWDTTIY